MSEFYEIEPSLENYWRAIIFYLVVMLLPISLH